MSADLALCATNQHVWFLVSGANQRRYNRRGAAQAIIH